MVEDDVAKFNQERWDNLAQQGVRFSVPWEKIDAATARQWLDPFGLIGDPRGKDVLCLAGGGGQQAVAFALLGANTTVFDLSGEMLARDRATGEKLGLTLHLEQGDMRDLSRFGDASFDVVWHAYSINFVPDPIPIFDEVKRILRPGGIYRNEFHNPFVYNVDEIDWNGSSYPVKSPYVQGAEAENTTWTMEDENGIIQQIQGPREFRHILSVVLNNLAERGFILLRLVEGPLPEGPANPGTWDHFVTFAPPWISIWMSFRPDIIGS